MLRRGFSLLEVVVALGLMSLLLVYVFSAFSLQNATYHVVDQISEVQKNSSAVARLLERDIRTAGYLVPPAAAACGVDSTTAPDALFVSDSDAILPPDELAVEFAGDELGAEVTTEPTSTGVFTLSLDDAVVDGVASYDTDSDGTEDSDFRVGGGAILVDRGNPTRGVSCGIVTAINPATPTVTVDFLAVQASASPAAKDLKLVPAHVYRIVTASGVSRLERDGQMLAKDVEDLQLAWFYDDDNDGVVDDPGETRGVPATPYDSSSVTGEELREIRINLVMSTRTNDSRNEDDAGIGQARENRTVASVPPADGKHRRVHTATVRLRNLTL